jgi:lysophospholipase L1-like esterase
VFAKLLLATASAIVALLLLEVALRVVWDNPYARELPDRVLALSMQHAHANLPIDRSVIDPEQPTVRLRTNDRSYIEPAAVHDSPEATIVFLGGSTTECSVVSEPLRFPARVGALLTERGVATNALNAGRSGNTLHDSLNVLLNHVVHDAPDVVVLMHATNDVGVLSRGGGYRGRSGTPVDGSALARWSLQILSSRSSLLGVARNLARPRLQPDAGGGPTQAPVRNDASGPRVDPAPFVARLRTFVRAARAFGIEPVLMTQPLSSSRNELTPEWADPGNQDVFNEQIRRVAREEDALLVDLVRHVQETVPGWNEPGRLFYDGMHVNDRGSEVYARHIADRLEPLVRSAGGR